MKNKIRKNKLIIITIILYIVVSLLFNSKSYASDDSSLIVTLPSINNIVSSNDKWFIIWDVVREKYVLCSTDNYISYWGNKYLSGDEIKESQHDHFLFVYKEGCHHRRYILDNNNWVLLSENEGMNFIINCSYDIKSNIVASNFDLRNDPRAFGNDNVVFQKATTLSTLRGTHLNQETWKATKMMVIVMVAVIGLLILLIGVKKGFQILVNGLKI